MGKRLLEVMGLVQMDEIPENRGKGDYPSKRATQARKEGASARPRLHVGGWQDELSGGTQPLTPPLLPRCLSGKMRMV